MNQMSINYILMVLCGGFAAVSIVSKMKKGHFVGRASRTIFSVIVFILAFVATIMNMPITQLQQMIETMGK